MFEVRIMVDDKKLSQVMWALDSMIVGEPTIRPVRTASSPASSNGLGLPERVAELIAKDKYLYVSTAILGKLIVKEGGKASSVNFVVKQLKRDKIIGNYLKATKTYPVK